MKATFIVRGVGVAVAHNESRCMMLGGMERVSQSNASAISRIRQDQCTHGGIPVGTQHLVRLGKIR